MKQLYIVPLFIFLTSCATTKRCDPIEIKVPVYYSCVSKVPDVPQYTVNSLTEESSDFDKIKAITVDYLEQRKYINELESIVNGCI